MVKFTGPCSTVGNMPDCRYVSDCIFGVPSSIPAWSHTFRAIDREIISTPILLPYSDSRRVVVSYKQKHVHKVLVNCLVKLAQEKSMVRRTDRPAMTIAVDCDVKNQIKQTNAEVLKWNLPVDDLASRL